MPRFAKGSKEAKEWGAMMRAKRGKGLARVGDNFSKHPIEPYQDNQSSVGGTIQTNVFAEFLKEWAKEHNTDYAQAIKSKKAKKDFEKYKETLPPTKSFVPDKPNISFSVQPSGPMIDAYEKVAEEQPPLEPEGAFDQQDVEEEIEVGIPAPIPDQQPVKKARGKKKTQFIIEEDLPEDLPLQSISKIEQQYPIFKEMFDNSVKRGRQFYYEFSDLNDFQKYYGNDTNAQEAFKEYTALQKQRAQDMPQDFVWTDEDDRRRDEKLARRAEQIRREAKSKPKRRNDDVYEELMDDHPSMPYDERRIRENISDINGVKVIPLSIVEETGLPIFTSKQHNSKLYTMFDGESIWIDDAGIKGKGFLFGGKLQVNEIKGLLDKSYTDTTSDFGRFKLDRELSNPEAQVYYDPENDHPVVVHTGTHNLADWGTNASLLVGYRGKRYNNAKRVQQMAERKYGTKNLTTLGHSQSGRWAEELGQNGREIITLNKATTPLDLRRSVSDKQFDIRTEKDPVSIISKSNKNAITIKSETNNPLTEHSVNVLDRLDPDMVIGRGILEWLFGTRDAPVHPTNDVPIQTPQQVREIQEEELTPEQLVAIRRVIPMEGKPLPKDYFGTREMILAEQKKDMEGRKQTRERYAMEAQDKPERRQEQQQKRREDREDKIREDKRRTDYINRGKPKETEQQFLPQSLELSGPNWTKRGTGVVPYGNVMLGGKAGKPDLIDFEDLKWGSFTQQFDAYNSTHKGKKKMKDLEQFAKMILADPSKFQSKTLKRARFYLNVLLPKKSKK